MRTLVSSPRLRPVVLWLTLAAAIPAPSILGQSLREYPIPSQNAGPVSIVAGSDGALWFAENLRGRIGRITLTGQISEFQLPPPVAPRGLASGPDGAIWWASDGGQIGNVTTSGSVTVIDIPGASDTGLIAEGPDGAMWFFRAYDEVARRTLAGVLTVFPVPTPSPVLGGLCRGPDGNMWFTVSVNGFKIDRLSVSGVLTEFDAHTTTNMPLMTVGPDNALWFTQPYAADGVGRIGRISMTGAVTHYDVPGRPFCITSGPDGALWYGDAQGAIGRLALDGTATRVVTLRASASPQSIITGPDRAIWFTEFDGFIGRLELPETQELSIPTLSSLGLAAFGVFVLSAALWQIAARARAV